MSRILRRPMFRGGRVDSRGTGLHLDYDGGIVGGVNGGDTVTGGQIVKQKRIFSMSGLKI